MLLHGSGDLGADHVLQGLATGIVAGLAVAVPLGAVGVLLLQEGLLRGRRSALAAALAVAVVDLLYAVAAVLAGAAVSAALVGRRDQLRLLCACVLAVLALRGLSRGLRTAPKSSAAATRPTGSRRVFWRFCALTALNPLTAVLFTVLAAGLGGQVREPLPAAAFALGVFAGSLGWQTLLALSGAALGSRLSPVARRWTGTVGHLLLLGLAVGVGVAR